MELQNVGYDWATFTHNHYYWYEISQNMNILDILINELKTLKTQFENALLNELDFFLSCMYGWTLLLARMRIQSQIYLFSFLFVSSLVAQTVKRLPAMWETWVWTLGWEPTEEGMATHSSILAWRIPMDGGAWWATVHGVAKSFTRLSD